MFITLADMKTYLGETTTDYDDFLTAQIQLFSDTIDDYCGRKFEAASYTQSFYMNDFWEDYYFYLFHYPVNTITSVSEVVTDYGVDTTTALETYQYRIKKDNGKLTRLDEGLNKYWFSCASFNSRVDVVFNAGYTTIPLQVQDVVYSLVEERYNKKKSGIALGFGSDVQRVSIPGVMSLDFDYTLQANQRSVAYGMLLGNYVNVLDPYRSERVLVGEIKDNYVA